MRRAIFAAALVLLPLSAHAQSRPAPDTPGPSDTFEDTGHTQQQNLTSALRVLVVTSGIIGGFIAADIMSGGVLTAPLLSGGTLASAGTSGARLFSRAAPIRPIITGTAASPVSAGVARKAASNFTEVSSLVSRLLAKGKPIP